MSKKTEEKLEEITQNAEKAAALPKQDRLVGLLVLNRHLTVEEKKR